MRTASIPEPLEEESYSQYDPPSGVVTSNTRKLVTFTDISMDTEEADDEAQLTKEEEIKNVSENALDH